MVEEDIQRSIGQAERGFILETPAPFWKARPSTEGEERYIFMEPSNEDWDVQGQRVLQKALVAQAEYYRRFGNVDINHITLLGPLSKDHGGLGMSRDEAKLHEIGHPVDVITSPVVAVKARLYRGEGPRVAKANAVWEELQIGRRYYPSVGGVPLHVADDGTIEKVVWSNVGLADTPHYVPVNRTVKSVSLMPLATFAKAALAAGYGTQGLSGGAALRRESLHPNIARQLPDDASYYEMVARYLKSLGTGCCEHTGGDAFEDRGQITLAKAVSHFRTCEGQDLAKAHEIVARLVRDASRQLGRRKNTRRAA